jgi:hypothetical protein
MEDSAEASIGVDRCSSAADSFLTGDSLWEKLYSTLTVAAPIASQRVRD